MILTHFHCFNFIILFNICIGTSIVTQMGNFDIHSNSFKNNKNLQNQIILFSDYLVKEFGSIGKNNFTITIVNNKNILPHNFPTWATGIAVNNSIFIDNTKINSHVHLLKVIRHEISHLYQNKIKNSHTFPSWFKEGMAMAMAKEFSIDSRYLVSRALWMNCLLDLNDLDKFSTLNETEINLAYEQSLIAYEKIIKLFKKNSIQDILFKMNNENLTFHIAFEKVLNISVEDFEDKYNQELNTLWAVIFNKSNFWFFIATIILFIIFIAVKLRNRKIIKKWEIEELNELE